MDYDCLRIHDLFVWIIHNLLNWLKTSLTPPLFIEVSVPSKKNERSCITLLGVSGFHLSWFFYWFLELFRQLGFFLFHFIWILLYIVFLSFVILICVIIKKITLLNSFLIVWKCGGLFLPDHLDAYVALCRNNSSQR